MFNKKKNDVSRYDNVAKYNDGNYEINEAYRGIRTFLTVDENIKTILITSSEMNEGKTTTVANIARCFSELDNKKTIVIDCDFRKQSINKYFRLSKNTKGLSDIIYENKELEICVQKDGDLDILCSGTFKANPAVLLQSSKMKKLIEYLKEKYDYILIDSPPVGRVNDACIIAQYVDGTVVVAASKETEKSQVKVTKDRLEKVNANIIGVVLNKFKTNEYKSYSYYGYYDYEDDRKFRLFKNKRRA
ncbi:MULTISPECIES: CpsD/CapB family tyrosine-protein kinase [unclassified Romboutsia]|uniref:CpsD/CapB family tyrosine-protein kinase n=1 Tax=unclassified Romboutsia TaxID=2626894 RepID=UPI0008213C46|nr:MULTISPECIES: CpsD/CapB family tyrosine-protein kinase [unclassified Romboutsia]SCH19713.1 Tyrosine-protein kinase YwqD [uncultured Clostridium sp.]